MVDNESGVFDLVDIGLAVIVFGAVAFIGLYMMDKTATTAAIANSSQFYAAQTSAATTISTFFDMSVILILAFILAVAVGYFLMIRGRAR